MMMEYIELSAEEYAEIKRRAIDNFKSSPGDWTEREESSRGEKMKTVSRRKSISAEVLENLFDNSDVEYEGWKVVGGYEADDSFYSHTGRWHDVYWFVLEDPDGELWGITWSLGLTEYQDNQYPWDGVSPDKELKLSLMEKKEMTTTIYRPKKDEWLS